MQCTTDFLLSKMSILDESAIVKYLGQTSLLSDLTFFFIFYVLDLNQVGSFKIQTAEGSKYNFINLQLDTATTTTPHRYNRIFFIKYLS